MSGTVIVGLVRACVRQEDEDATFARSILVALCERAAAHDALYPCVRVLAHAIAPDGVEQPTHQAAALRTVTGACVYSLCTRTVTSNAPRLQPYCPA